MKAPTEKAPVGQITGAAELRLLDVRPHFGRIQVWQGWQREAARLFNEFWRTADERHLRAFSAHVYGMRLRQGSGSGAP